MNTSLSAKFVAAAALTVAAIAAAPAAHARSDVYFSIGVQGGAPVYVEPAPVYVQPRPVIIQPGPVYVQPPVYAVPAPMYYGRPAYDAAYEQERAWRRAEWQRRWYWRHHHHEWEQNQYRGRNWD